MVKGLDTFRDHFADFTDSYVLIGGTASSLAIEALGGEFRATKDLDIVLCVEALDGAFVTAFWDFVQRGQYENRQKGTEKRQFYRFFGPARADFPAMLELFSRRPDALDLPDEARLSPVPMEDQVSSLSAILMDDDYYAFVMGQRTVQDGLPFIPATGLIPLKAHAFKNLSDQKAQGGTVDSKQINKHRNDIYRLFAVMDRGQVTTLPDGVRQHLEEALDLMADTSIELKPFALSRMKVPEAIAELKRLYGIQVE